MYCTKQWVKGLISKVLKKTVNNYSLEEQKVGTWIDGKPLYQKVLTGTIDKLSFSVDISELKIDTIVNISGIQKGYFTDGSFIDSSYLFTGSPNALEGSFNIYVATGHKLGIQINDNVRLNTPYYITVQYTKTTD